MVAAVVVFAIKRRELAVAGGGRREEARVGRILQARAKLEIGRSKPSF